MGLMPGSALWHSASSGRAPAGWRHSARREAVRLNSRSNERTKYRWLRHRLKTENAKLHSYYHAHSPLLSFLL